MRLNYDSAMENRESGKDNTRNINNSISKAMKQAVTSLIDKQRGTKPIQLFEDMMMDMEME